MSRLHEALKKAERQKAENGSPLDLERPTVIPGDGKGAAVPPPGRTSFRGCRAARVIDGALFPVVVESGPKYDAVFRQTKSRRGGRGIPDPAVPSHLDSGTAAVAEPAGHKPPALGGQDSCGRQSGTGPCSATGATCSPRGFRPPVFTDAPLAGCFPLSWIVGLSQWRKG